MKKVIISRIKETVTWRLAIGIFAGGALGYAYYYYVGCASGACPITSNPIASVVWGMLFGALIGYKEKKDNK